MICKLYLAIFLRIAMALLSLLVSNAAANNLYRAQISEDIYDSVAV